MESVEAGEPRSPGKIQERFAAFEARKKALFCDLSRRMVRRIVKRHEKSLELLGDHKE